MKERKKTTSHATPVSNALLRRIVWRCAAEHSIATKTCVLGPLEGSSEERGTTSA